MSVTVYVGNTPTIFDTISDQSGSSVDLTGATVTFVYRPSDMSSPAVSIAATPDPDQVANQGLVAVTLGSPIMDAVSEWAFWWHVVFASAAILDTDNTDLVVQNHGPGNGTSPYLTPALFRRITRVKQSRLGIAFGQPNAEELLQFELDRAAAYVAIVTGQPATDSTVAPATTLAGSIAPAVMSSLLVQAIQMRTEQVTFQAQNGYVDDASDDVVTTFSVGSYSQSKADATRRGEEKTLNSWQALSNILWLLMTPDRYDYWVNFLSSDPTMAVSPYYGFENTIEPGFGGGYGGGFLGFGWADYALGNYSLTGWSGGLGGLPGGPFPLPVD